MNIQRFTAPTSREALAKARMAFGDGTLILSNRPTENGVEVVATAEDSLASLEQTPAKPMAKVGGVAARSERPAAQDFLTKVEDDAAQLSMSTLSFQDYVRERMLRKRNESGTTNSAEIFAAPPQEKPRAVAMDRSPAKQEAARKPQAPAAPVAAMPQGIVDELHAMKEMMEDRFNTLAWLGQARQNPIQSNLMLKLIRSGYSPNLARTILERMPEDMSASESVHWVMDVLERNLRTDADSASLNEEGGVFALIGATGVGKTTTIGKLAYQFTQEGKKVMLGAADTFRAAAVDQLTIWSERVKVPIISQGMGADPASVAFDTVSAAVSQDIDICIIDTAGRLHNKVNLMNELSKIKRVMQKVVPDAPHEVLLVLDASTGQNAIEQAKQFTAATEVNALALTKLDGTAKGGVVLAIAHQFKIPVKFIGVGERMEDLMIFNKDAFVDSLFSLNNQ